ncbi:MAG: heavy-metal-associated domain-containing protein [Firmicutes bacterium]|nr:heavy-metal-associated domain-containing protein [Bacillota bacterium]
MSENIVLRIEGMSCKHCQAAVEDALKKLEGVESVKVDLKEGKSYITFDSSLLTKENLIEAVVKAGY